MSIGSDITKKPTAYLPTNTNAVFNSTSPIMKERNDDQSVSNNISYNNEDSSMDIESNRPRTPQKSLTTTSLLLSSPNQTYAGSPNLTYFAKTCELIHYSLYEILII